MTNPLQQLGEVGQAVWLDFIDRRILETGGLKRLTDAARQVATPAR